MVKYELFRRLKGGDTVIDSRAIIAALPEEKIGEIYCDPDTGTHFKVSALLEDLDHRYNVYPKEYIPRLKPYERTMSKEEKEVYNKLLKDISDSTGEDYHSTQSLKLESVRLFLKFCKALKKCRASGITLKGGIDNEGS